MGVAFLYDMPNNIMPRDINAPENQGDLTGMTAKNFEIKFMAQLPIIKTLEVWGWWAHLKVVYARNLSHKSQQIKQFATKK